MLHVTKDSMCSLIKWAANREGQDKMLQKQHLNRVYSVAKALMSLCVYVKLWELDF